MTMIDGRTASLLFRGLKHLPVARLRPLHRSGLPLLLGSALVCACPGTSICSPRQAPRSGQNLADLNLEQLGNIEVTTYSKAPTGLWDTPAAMVVITDRKSVV